MLQISYCMVWILFVIISVYSVSLLLLSLLLLLILLLIFFSLICWWNKCNYVLWHVCLTTPLSPCTQKRDMMDNPWQTIFRTNKGNGLSSPFTCEWNSWKKRKKMMVNSCEKVNGTNTKMYGAGCYTFNIILNNGTNSKMHGTGY